MLDLPIILVGFTLAGYAALLWPPRPRGSSWSAAGRFRNNQTTSVKGERK